jgi:S-(hydroxymethyl)mycothiol dehydrogenase
MTLVDGTPLWTALGIGGFAELTLVAAEQAIKVNPRTRPEAAALIGCGVMAGYGAALYTGDVRQGDSVAVFGCGTVGDAAIHASAMVGAPRIIAVDIEDRKLQLALEFGATDAVNSAGTDPVEAVRALTDGLGADITIEATGLEDVVRQAFLARDYGGIMVQAGVPERSMRIDLPLREFFTLGGPLKPSHYGDCLPTRDFPILIDLYLAGRYDLDRFVSEVITLGQVERALSDMRSSQMLRSVVVS